MYFKSIRKTLHYVIHHEKQFPWSKVIEIMLTTKDMRKKDNNIEIETENYYILGRIENNILWIKKPLCLPHLKRCGLFGFLDVQGTNHILKDVVFCQVP